MNHRLIPIVPALVSSLLLSCVAPRNAGSPVIIDPDAVLKPRDAIGTWTLADNLNNCFNLVLAPDGSAVSTWSRADPSKPGETGAWRIEGGRIIVDLSSGWRDEIIPAANAFATKSGGDPESPFIESDAFVQASWAPNADRSRDPSNGGKAVKLKGSWVNWVGLWLEAGSPRTWAFQSDNLVFGGEGNPAMGLWHVHDDKVVVQWADARRSELRVKGDHVEATTVRGDGTTAITRLDRLHHFASGARTGPVR